MEAHIKQARFLFWQRWLFYTSLLFASYGLIFALWGKNFFFLPYDRMIAGVFWQSNQFPPEVEPFRAFIYGPLGGTITCCYILLAFIAKYPFKQKQTWARDAIVVSFGIWVTIDSSVCIYYRVYPQIYVINAFSVIVKALPIIFTWNQFSTFKSNSQNCKII